MAVRSLNALNFVPAPSCSFGCQYMLIILPPNLVIHPTQPSLLHAQGYYHITGMVNCWGAGALNLVGLLWL